MLQQGSSALIEEVGMMKVVKRKLTMPLLLVNLAVSLVSVERFSSLRFDSLRFASIRFSSIRFDSLRFSSIRFSPIPLGSHLISSLLLNNSVDPKWVPRRRAGWRYRVYEHAHHHVTGLQAVESLHAGRRGKHS